MEPFAERFNALAETRSPLCLGLDPSSEILRGWGLADDASGLDRFCKTVLDAAGDRVAVIKPQSAFFERMGAPGMSTLRAVLDRIRVQGALSLLDVKRGDVASTVAGYADAFMGAGAPFRSDAITVNAFLGFDALMPAFERAAASGAGVFIVVRSSNADGRRIQEARVQDGRTVAETIADAITALNARFGAALGPIGAVVGATLRPDETGLLERLPRSLILAPGVGAQGASMSDVGARFGAAIRRTLPSASRSLLRSGPGALALRDAIERLREQAFLNVVGYSAAASKGLL